MKQFVVFSLTIVVLFLATPLMWAQDTCTPIYGGGQDEDDNPFCLEQVQAASNTGTATPTQGSGFTTPNDNLTKGGQPTTPSTGGTQTKGGMAVQPASPLRAQPNTGPELFGLAALIPAAAAGWALRRKTSSPLTKI